MSTAKAAKLQELLFCLYAINKTGDKTTIMLTNTLSARVHMLTSVSGSNRIKESNLVPRAHVSFGQFFLTKRHVGSGNEIARNHGTCIHQNNHRCPVKDDEYRYHCLVSNREGLGTSL